MKRKTIYALIAALIIVLSGLIVWGTLEPGESAMQELYARWKNYKMACIVYSDPAPCFIQIMLTPSGRDNKPDKIDSDKADSADGNIDQSAE
jgi:hypothetical protein